MKFNMFYKVLKFNMFFQHFKNMLKCFSKFFVDNFFVSKFYFWFFEKVKKLKNEIQHVFNLIKKHVEI